MGKRDGGDLLVNTLKWTARTTLGLLLCSGLALCAAYCFSRLTWNAFVPLLFGVVIIAIAVRYGVTVGILGSLVSAAIFAHLLYSPYHSLEVDDRTARAALAWMILGGTVVPYLLLPGLHPRRNKK